MKGNKKVKNGKQPESKKKKEKNNPIIVVFNKSGKLSPDLIRKLDELEQNGVQYYLLNTNKINESQARDLMKLQNIVVEIHDYVEGKMKDISGRAEKIFQDLEKQLQKNN